MKQVARWLGVWGVLTMAGGEVAGQAEVTGQVIDTAGVGLVGVEVVVGTSGLKGVTGEAGRFHLAGVPAGPQVLLFRLIGYQPQQWDHLFANGDSIGIEVVMARAVQTLPTITALSRQAQVSPKMAGYWQRKELGFGTFIQDSLLRTREHSSLSDVLRRVPGLTLEYLGDGGGLAVLMSRARSAGAITPGAKRCYAQVYLDGIRIYAPGRLTGDNRGFSIDQFKVSELQAIEIYKGSATTPAQFNSTGSACGTIVLWTRER
jgi:hypothetical protein